MQKTAEMEFEIAKFQLQRIDNEIKAIRDMSTLLLGYLVIVLAALVSFIFTDSSDLVRVRLLAGVLLIVYAINASFIIGILAASFESPSDDKSENIAILNEKIEAGLKKLNTLKIWFRFSLGFAFASLITVCAFAVNSLV